MSFDREFLYVLDALTAFIFSSLTSNLLLYFVFSLALAILTAVYIGFLDELDLKIWRRSMGYE